MDQAVWKPVPRKMSEFYCPNCRTHRKVAGQLSPYTGMNVLRVALATGMFTIAMYSWLEWKGVVAFLPIWIVFETVHRLKFRSALGCPHCGFDACLYMSDAKRARQEVEDYWRRVFRQKGVPFPGDPLPEATAEDSASDLADDDDDLRDGISRGNPSITQ